MSLHAPPALCPKTAPPWSERRHYHRGHGLGGVAQGEPGDGDDRWAAGASGIQRVDGKSSRFISGERVCTGGNRHQRRGTGDYYRGGPNQRDGDDGSVLRKTRAH